MEEKITPLKITNSFYCIEASDTELSFSTPVPESLNEMEDSFQSKRSFNFLKNFKRSLNNN